MQLKRYARLDRLGQSAPWWGTMNYPAIIAMLALLVALFRIQFLNKFLALAEDEARDAYTKWRYSEHVLSAANNKITRLIGERAQLQHKIESLQGELRRKHRRVRV